MSNKILVSCPIGHTFVRGILNSFNNQDMLHSFHTSVACFDGDFLDKLANLPLLNDFRRRKFSIGIRDKTTIYPYMELGRMIAQKLQLKSWLMHETGKFCTDKVFQSFDSHIAKYISKQAETITAVYAYEDCSLETFRQAKKSGIKCIYDLPIAYWKYGTQLMKEEATRLPEWAITLGGGIKDSDEKHNRKVEELGLADVVFCPSSFVRNSLPDWSKNKLIIESPFGTPQTIKTDISNRRSDKLRVLFVGSMGQRKGLGDLFEAIKLLNNKNIELVVLGSLVAPLDFYKKQLPDFIYEKTRPHNQVLELMQTCDIFCLPSIVEGRALVMQEAMSQGLPIIITPNTGGEDLVMEKETGFLVPIRSPQSIAEKINWFFENKNLIPAMGEKAKQHAASYTWEKYGNIISNTILNFIH
jgi:glycosyltransferase involved in cell wall biosynthesis